MRIPEENEDLTGKVCVCSIGRLGLVVGREDIGWGLTYVGLALDTRECRTWASRHPVVIADNPFEYYRRLKPKQK
jgi:hypothetical protein